MSSTTIDRINGINSGVAIKAPVRAATTANITLSGEQTIDGVAVVAGDRVLVKNQTSGVDNGIYDVATSAWSRSLDFDGINDIVTGTVVYVVSGTTLANSAWQITTTGTLIPGTTSLTFAQTVNLSTSTSFTSDATWGTGAQIFLDDSITTAGAALPLAFDGDPDTGFYRPGANSVACATNSNEVWRATADRQFAVADGSASQPGITFASDLDTGFYRVGANAFSAVNNSGTEVWQVNANGQFAISDGSAATPSLSFLNDLDNGIYRAGANSWGLSAGGKLALAVIGSTSAVNYIELQNSATGSPPYFIAKGSDTNIDARFEAKGTGTLRSESAYTNTTASAANVFINSSGQFLRSTSSLRYKKDVQDYGRGLDDIMALRPVTYKGNSARDNGVTFAGLIAEEVDKAGLSEFVVYDSDGQPDALHYGQMIALAIKAIQELNAKVIALEAK